MHVHEAGLSYQALLHHEPPTGLMMNLNLAEASGQQMRSHLELTNNDARMAAFKYAFQHAGRQAGSSEGVKGKCSHGLATTQLGSNV
jgi:hypothetical protein